MKKRLYCFLMIVPFIFCGCSSTVALSGQSNDILAEYMANLLLKYDRNQTPTLLDEKQIKVAKQEEKTTAQSNVETKTEEKKIQTYSQKTIAQLLGVKKCEISYEKYGYYQTKNSDAVYQLRANKGKRLLKVNFQIKNLSNQKQKINLTENQAQYKLETNEQQQYSALLTFLQNDLQTIKTTIPAGKSITACLLFEIPENQKASQLSLIIENGDQSKKITL